MGKPSLRKLMHQVLRVAHSARQGHQPGKLAGGQRRARQLFVEPLEDRCLLSSTLQAISVPAGNQPPSDTAAGTSLYPAVSADGRYVAFQSSAPNLFQGQTGGSELNVFLLDRNSGQVTLVSHVPGNSSAMPTSGRDRDSYRPLISRDGRYVVYNTIAPEIEGPTPGGFLDTYTNVI